MTIQSKYALKKRVQVMRANVADAARITIDDVKVEFQRHLARTATAPETTVQAYEIELGWLTLWLDRARRPERRRLERVTYRPSLYHDTDTAIEAKHQ